MGLSSKQECSRDRVLRAGGSFRRDAGGGGAAPPAALPGPEPGQPPHTQGPCRWPHLAPPPQKQPPGSRLSVSQGKEYVREKRRRKCRGAGSRLSLPSKPAWLSVQIARHLNAAGHHRMLRRALAPDLRGGDTGPCPWHPPPGCRAGNLRGPAAQEWLKAEAASHHLPSDGRTGTRASAACSPSMRLWAGIASAGNLMLGAWTTCADAGGGEGQGPFQMTGKSGRKRERPAQEGQVVGGTVSPARPPVPSEDSGHSGNALAQQVGGLGADLLAGDRSARRTERAESCPSTAGAPRHSRVHSLDVRAPQTLSCDHSLAGAVSCGTAPSRPRVPVPRPTQMRLHR